jgi:PAS domain-containing protein
MTAQFIDETSALSADEPLLRLAPSAVGHSHAVRSASGLTSFLGLLSVDGTLLESNQSASTPLDFSAQDALGRPFWEAIWWSWSPIVQQRLRSTVREVATGRVFRYHETALVRRNQLITVDLACAPIRGGGRATALICSVVDLSGSRQTGRSTGGIR